MIIEDIMRNKWWKMNKNGRAAGLDGIVDDSYKKEEGIGVKGKEEENIAFLSEAEKNYLGSERIFLLLLIKRKME